MDLVASIAGIVVQTAQADGVETACKLIGGCQPENVAVSFITPVVNLLVAIIAGVSVLFVMYGGALMLISLGDESRFTTGKNSIIYALVGFAIALVSQSVVAFVEFQATGVVTVSAATGNPALALIHIAINSMLYLFNAVFAAIMIFAGFRLLIGRGKSEELEAAKKMLIYAGMGAIIINVAKAMVFAVLNVFIAA